MAKRLFRLVQQGYNNTLDNGIIRRPYPDIWADGFEPEYAGANCFIRFYTVADNGAQNNVASVPLALGLMVREVNTNSELATPVNTPAESVPAPEQGQPIPDQQSGTFDGYINVNTTPAAGWF